MLTEIWQQIWRNLYVRYAILGFFFLIVAAGILQSRHAILNFWDRTFRAASFDDPFTWSGDIYGFEEDKTAAQRLYVEAIRQVVEEAYDTYHREEPDEIFKKPPADLPNWQEVLKAEPLEIVSNYFADMKLFCQPLVNDGSLTNQFAIEERLKKRHLKKSDNNNPFDYAISKENVRHKIEWLRSLDYEYIALALQRKPDAKEVIKFRKHILESACQPLIYESNNTVKTDSFTTINSWQKAIDYIEFKEEKKVVLANGGLKQKDYAMQPDELYRKIQLNLKKNQEYKAFLREFFTRSFATTENLDYKLQASWSRFVLTQEKVYLKAFIDSTLKKSRVVSQEKNQQIFNDLFALKYPGIETDADYVYVLAETAFRSGHLKLVTGQTGYNQSKALCNNIIKQGLHKAPGKERNVRRLHFMLSLLGY